MEKTFGVIVYLKRSKMNQKGEAPLIGRITVDSKRTEIALHLRVDAERWDNAKNAMKGSREDARVTNLAIAGFKNKITQIFQNLKNEDEIIEAELIKNIYLGKDKRAGTLLGHYKKVMENIKERVNIDYSPNTIKKYKTTQKHLEEYIKSRYQLSDRPLKKLNVQFIEGFEHYLKVTARQSQSSVFKHIQRTRRAISNALGEGIIDKDPFFGFKTSKGQTHRDFLTKAELERIENKQFQMERLQEIKDVFVFSCYTGIAFIDMLKMTKDSIIIGIDGNKWISGYRHKTKSKFSVPLLPKAMQIIEKYKDHPKVLAHGGLLPIMSSQKTNSYLKEIADFCEINKNLTFHVARHTFATTVTLLNGVPIETISKMLGHQNIATTQIYSKVVEEKVSEDMNNLVRKLSS
ncbi:MAG: site-specific integrase [Bacteroidales bacterium]|nr:site-specific integrase [Bacteroidales bacterium]